MAALYQCLSEIDTEAARGDLVFTIQEIGNYVPAYSMANTWVGHSFQSENFYERSKTANEFCSVMTTKQRLNLLNNIRPDYIIVPRIVMSNDSNPIILPDLASILSIPICRKSVPSH